MPGTLEFPKGREDEATAFAAKLGAQLHEGTKFLYRRVCCGGRTREYDYSGIQQLLSGSSSRGTRSQRPLGIASSTPSPMSPGVQPVRGSIPRPDEHLSQLRRDGLRRYLTMLLPERIERDANGGVHIIPRSQMPRGR